MAIIYKIIDAEDIVKFDAFYGEGMSKHLRIRLQKNLPKTDKVNKRDRSEL